MDSLAVKALSIALNHELNALPEALEEIERLRARVRELERERAQLQGLTVALRLRLWGLVRALEDD